MWKRAISLVLMSALLLTLTTGAGAADYQVTENTRFIIIAPTILQSTQATYPVSTVTTTSVANPYSTFKSWIKQLKQTNKDVTGWLKVPNTNINVPIVQTTKENGNTYYNTRDWKGVDYPGRDYTNYAMTSTFLDVRAVMGESWRSSSRNTVIYGHNWTNLRSPYNIGATYTNHVMLAQLPSYTDIKFAKENPYIYYSTENMEGIWKVFAVATCEVSNSFDYIAPNPSEEKFASIIKEWKDRSIFDFSTEVDSNDRILTISTCTREYPNAGASQRFVVVARLLRSNETENDAVTVAVNADKKIPVFGK